MDRFIPSRTSFDRSQANFTIEKENNTENLPFQRLISNVMLNKTFSNPNKTNSIKKKSSVLSFKKSINTSNTFIDDLESIYKDANKNFPSKNDINQTPIANLPLTDLKDDFYLNLISWGPNNLISIARNNIVHLWDWQNDNNTILTDSDGEYSNHYISAVYWIIDTNLIALGTSSGFINIFDLNKMEISQSFQTHHKRISVLCSKNNMSITSSGSEKNIVTSDLRTNKMMNNFTDFSKTLLYNLGHEREVCGLSWSPYLNYLASGCNDNTIRIWDERKGILHILNQHKAAVKALSWSPNNKNLLISGGGTNDKTIKFWNTTNGELINSFNTYNQICGINWNENGKQIISAHGYCKNNVCLWKYPEMWKITELNGHVNRILYMKLNIENNMIATASPKDSLKIWQIKNKHNYLNDKKIDKFVHLR